MKKLFIPLGCSLLMMSWGCSKHVSEECLQAKVVRITCASTVLQVLNNSSIGQDSWLDMYDNNKTYDNVFAVSNACKLASEYKVGDVVYITTAKPTDNDCVHCALYDAAPRVSYDVKTIGNLPCSEASK